MKKLLPLFAVFVLISFFSRGQSQNEKQIRNVLLLQEKAWNKGDIDQFMQGYWKSDSLLFVGSKAPQYGWQTTLNNYKKTYPDTVAMGRLAFEIREIKMLSDQYSFVLGKWHLTRSQGDIGGYFTLLFRKIKNQWFITVDHTS